MYRKKSKWFPLISLGLLMVVLPNFIEQLSSWHISDLAKGLLMAQISKIENSVKNARLETILKVFEALGAKVNFNVELNQRKLAY